MSEEHVHLHTHVHAEDGHTHTHDDGHTHVHGHFHSPEEKKRQINRLSRVIGHLNHVKGMIERDEDCAEVLIQLSAAKSALNGLGRQIISEHITHCVSHAVEDGDTKALEEFQEAIKKFI